MPARKQIIIISMVFVLVAIIIVAVIGKQGEGSVDDTLTAAKEYYDKLDYDKAIALYNNVLNSDDECTDAYIGLAEAYIAKDNISKAAEILERGLECAENSDLIYEKYSEFAEEYGEINSAEFENEPEDEFDGEFIDNVPEITEPVPVETAVAEPTDAVTETTTAVPETTAPPQTTTAAPQTTTAAPVTTTAPVTTRVVTTTTVPKTTTAATTTTMKPTIEMPNFIGMDKDEAVKLAKQLKIDLSLKYDKNDTYENNIIYYQSHRAGSMVSEKTDVEVYVCVNDKKKVTEDDLKLQNFYNAIKTFGDSNSKIANVVLNEKNYVVTVTVSSFKGLKISKEVAEEFTKCKNAVLIVKSSSMSMTINSSSVTSGEMNLSADSYENENRCSLTMSALGSLNYTAGVTILDSSIPADDLKKMTIHYDNKKAAASFTVDSNGKPVITVSSGGTYTIY